MVNLYVIPQGTGINSTLELLPGGLLSHLDSSHGVVRTLESGYRLATDAIRNRTFSC